MTIITSRISPIHQPGRLRASVRYVVYIEGMPLEMHLVVQLARTVGMGTFELLLIFSTSEVCIYVFVEDVFSRPGFHALFVRELLVAYTKAAYWVGQHYRVQMSRLNLYNVFALGCIRLLFYNLATSKW